MTDFDFSTINVLVIGDIILDQYIHGTVTRTSPEANVPVVLQQSVNASLGGAANVALNIESLKSNAILLGGIGNDTEGLEIEKKLADTSLNTTFLISTPKRCTTTKTRIIDNEGHLIRVDREDTAPYPIALENILITNLQKILTENKIDIIILQDYNKGVLTKSSIPRILEEVTQRNIPYVVDPKINNFFAYHGATLFKPNLKELHIAFQDFSEPINNLSKISNELRIKTNSVFNLITLGENGLYLDESNNVINLPALKVDTPDVCGAGDAVISIAALAIAKNCTLKEIARWSNAAGHLACTKIGVNPIRLDEFINIVEKM